MNHLKGKLIDRACRWPNGSMKNANGRTRKIAFCPDCQFEYRGPGCIFTPTKPRRPRHKTHNPTSGKWQPGDILERIIEHYEQHTEWPLTTTTYRNSQALPHSSTVKRHFPGGIAEAVAKAMILREKEIAERDGVLA